MEPTTVKEVAFSALRDLLGEKLECESVDERSAEGLKAIAGEIRANGRKSRIRRPRNRHRLDTDRNNPVGRAVRGSCRWRRAKYR